MKDNTLFERADYAYSHFYDQSSIGHKRGKGQLAISYNTNNNYPVERNLYIFGKIYTSEIQSKYSSSSGLVAPISVEHTKGRDIELIKAKVRLYLKVFIERILQKYNQNTVALQVLSLPLVSNILRGGI